MKVLGCEDLSTQLAKFSDGVQSLDEFQRWLIPVLVKDGENVEPGVRDLFFRVIYLVEDDSISVEERRRLAERVLGVLQIGSGVQILDEWFDVVMRGDQLRGLLGKLLDGTISRTSFLSGISKAGLTLRARELFVTKDRAAQRWLMNVLSAEDYGALLTGPSGHASSDNDP